MKWIWIILALVYLLSPYDLIPGLSAVGWIDDIIVLVLILRYVAKFKRMGDIHRPTQGQRHPPGDDRFEDTASRAEDRPRTPHEVLGVSPSASQADIKSAYRSLVARYHPDKVAHLGDEFQALAEQRFKEIQDAYQRLIRHR